MNDAVKVGLECSQTHTVSGDNAAPHLSVPVLATPEMIAMIEYCCMEATRPYMDEGETTVGAHVCVSHQAPTFLDEEYTIRAVLAKVEGRRLTFDVEVDNARGPVSRGTHQRGVVDFSKFG